MSDRRIESLNDAEERWVTEELENARRLVIKYSPNDAESPLSPEVLDRAFKAAYHEAPNDEEHANSTINAIGIAFGQYLVDQLGLQWCAVFDKLGSELAVIGLPGQADMLVFPPNLVAKRWATGTTDFLPYVYKGIEEDFANFRSHWEGVREASQAAQDTDGRIWKWFQRLFLRAARR